MTFRGAPPADDAPRRRGGLPPLTPATTSLWEYPSQDYDGPLGQTHGDPGYVGATPAWVVWQLVQQHTKPKDLVIDPMAGSGTTLDVARELGRRALGYDVHPTRPDIFKVDARRLPPELTGKAQLVFMDPPYSTHLDYGDDPRDIGKLDAVAGGGQAYFQALGQAIAEAERVLRPGGALAIYVSDTHKPKVGFAAIGCELYALARARLTPIEHVAVVRHNAKLQRRGHHAAAAAGGFLLRGFNHLLVFAKPGGR